MATMILLLLASTMILLLLASTMLLTVAGQMTSSSRPSWSSRPGRSPGCCRTQTDTGHNDGPSRTACTHTDLRSGKGTLIQDLTRFNKIQAKGPDGKWTRKPLAYRESNNVHLLITRPPEICVNLVFKHIHAASSYTICRQFVPFIYCPL